MYNIYSHQLYSIPYLARNSKHINQGKFISARNSKHINQGKFTLACNSKHKIK